MSLVEWRTGYANGFGWYCEAHAVVDGRTAYVWRSSPITTQGSYCWRIDQGPTHVMSPKANLGSAKQAAARALLRFPIEETYA